MIPANHGAAPQNRDYPETDCCMIPEIIYPLNGLGTKTNRCQKESKEQYPLEALVWQKQCRMPQISQAMNDNKKEDARLAQLEQQIERT